MKHPLHHLLLLLPLAAWPLLGQGQTDPFGPSDTTVKNDCGIYQWPEVQSPCPEVQIKQKHDHTPIKEYRDQGWDTAVTCNTRTIVLSCMPYRPVQEFNGQYTVDEIPFDPPDSTFSYGKQLPNSDDDKFCALQKIAYPFYFFGFKKEYFVAGGNGIITFSTGAANAGCDYGNYSPIPWPDGASGDATPTLSTHRDAIYGVFQDTDPGGGMSGKQGIWYGIMDEYPCRKIIASYNELPWYPHNSNLDNRQSYQIVCYEGSNIIEVHIKRRSPATCGWCNYGLIGIQNATGKPQVKGDIGTPTAKVVTGAPAAFYPPGRNPMTDKEVLDSIAYRFTPQGYTTVNYHWYRIFDDGRDSIDLTTDVEDTNGYYSEMGTELGDNCPTLTTAVVTPTTTSRYVFHMKFKNANDDWYNLYDTITIGMDTANNMQLHATSDPATASQHSICEGSEASLILEMPSLQVPINTVYSAWRISNGVQYDLPVDSVISVGQQTNTPTQKTWPITFFKDLPDVGKLPNKIDSIYIQISCDMASGCSNNDVLLLKIFPNFNDTNAYTICRGDKVVWTADGKTYTEPTLTTLPLQSQPGCDSVVTLDLKVLDVSYTVDKITDCKPITWINGKTYTESNNATAASDTLRLQNQWGCDSVVQLSFTMIPPVAQIQSSRSSFDYDNLTVQLNDISTGSNARIWLLPNGSTSFNSITYYTASPEDAEANIWLVAQSVYGCNDSANIIIPMRKETFWMPNAFTPDSPNGNTTFGSSSMKTLTQEMFIYSRTGELIFKCEEPDCQWDGRDQKGNLCPQGTYVYFVRYTNEYEPDRIQVRRGTLTLIR